MGYSQNYQQGKIIASSRIGPGTYRYMIPVPVANQTSGEVYDWKWQVWVEYISHKDTTKHSYLQVQTMGTDNTGWINWSNYAGLAADSMKHISTTVGQASPFEDPFGLCGRKLALKVYVGTADSVTLSAWYTIKR